MIVDGVSVRGLYRRIVITTYGKDRYLISIIDGSHTITSMAVSKQEFREQWAITEEMEGNVHREGVSSGS